MVIIPNYYTISPIYSYYYTQGTTLSIYPFSYQPVNGIINVVLEATICIEFDYGDLIETIDDLYQGQDFKSIITMLLYDTFNEFDVSLDLENKGDYLIIAAHRDMENILESYIAYKQSQNYNVEVVYLDEENALGNPTAIHQLIYSSSFLDNPDFVLLVGSLQDIPPYMGEDNIFNPFSDDPYHPLLGRWITTGENGYYPELINIIFKTTSSEVAYLSTTPTIESFSGTGTRTASRSFWKDIEMIDDKYVSQMGISNCMHDGRVYASSLHACLSIDSALCNNPRLFIYRGHGASDTNSCIIAPPYWLKSIATSHSSSMDLSLLTNTDPYPIGIGYACCLNSYLTNNNFGAKWISINGGGVEFYSSTVTSYRASNRALAKAEFSRLKTLTERLGNFPISLWLKLGEWDYLYACQSFPRYQQIYKYNLIGDPTFYVYGMSGEPQLYYSRNNQQMLSTHINGNNIEKVEIYDLSGNLIAIDGLKYNTTKHNSRTGVYIVRTIYKNGNINIYKLLQ